MAALCVYYAYMRIAVWDSAKARANRIKHGIRFSDAAGVLLDPMAFTEEDMTSSGERRFVTVGADYNGRMTVVVDAIGEAVPRIISARRATRKERRQYEEGI